MGIEARTHKIGTIAPPVDGDVIARAGIGPHGGSVTMWTTPSDKEALSALRELPGGARGPATVLDTDVQARVITQWPNEDRRTTAISVPVANCRIQPLPHGELLVAGDRCYWDDDVGAHHNAVIYRHRGTKSMCPIKTHCHDGQGTTVNALEGLHDGDA